MPDLLRRPAFLSALADLRRWPVRRVLLKQIYFTGVEALLMMLIVGFVLGGIVVSQLHDQYGQSREASLRLLASLTFSELSPLFTALILVARSSSAVASELAAMKVHGELSSLARMGIPLASYLIVPRLVGMTISAAALALYLALAALLGGVVLSSGWDITYQVVLLDRIMQPSMLIVCVCKGALFGFIAVVLACWVGLSAQPYVTEIPKASSRAVMRGLLAVFLLDFGWSLLA
ncbi:ABC transporter permease [Andreprevotia chitinilytica]|uniref:ABC transporter permease n=1 Tax=Andreprevotia chitinilytica TaxID=396808 RepID=UPI00055417D2|nr:ABC transporter permease [Andreprevotia chitinilytica]